MSVGLYASQKIFVPFLSLCRQILAKYLQISRNHFLQNGYLTTNHDNLPMSLNTLQPLQMKQCCLMTHKPVKLPIVFLFLPTIPDSYRDK